MKKKFLSTLFALSSFLTLCPLELKSEETELKPLSHEEIKTQLEKINNSLKEEIPKLTLDFYKKVIEGCGALDFYLIDKRFRDFTILVARLWEKAYSHRSTEVHEETFLKLLDTHQLIIKTKKTVSCFK